MHTGLWFALAYGSVIAVQYAKEPREELMSSRELSVIAPCLNEEGNVDRLIGQTLQTLDEHGIEGEIVLVDDGSVDGTAERVQSHADRDARVLCVRHPSNRGIVSAWISGLEASSGRFVCLIDADLQNRPGDIARLYAAHQFGNDLVQGVRHPSQGARRLLLFSRALNVLLNAAFLTHLRDSKSGFILCRRETLTAILTHRFWYRYFQCFVGASAAHHGCRIVEVDTIFDDRRAGESFLRRVPLGVSLRILWEILKFRLETLPLAGASRAIIVPELDPTESEEP